MNKVKLRFPALVATVLAICTAACWGAESIEKAELAGVANYSRLSGSIGYAGARAGFGGGTEPAAMAALRDEGYAAVINLRLAGEKGVKIEASRAAAEQAGITYIHLPFDAEKPDPAAIEAFLEALSDPANQPAYIHCGSATRAGALWMIGRVLEDGWALEQAAMEVEKIAKYPPRAIAFATGWIEKQEQ